jgi:hypothetical protein
MYERMGQQEQNRKNPEFGGINQQSRDDEP